MKPAFRHFCHLVLASGGLVAQSHVLEETVVEASAWVEEGKRSGDRSEFAREEIAQSDAQSVLDFLSTEAGLPFVSIYGNSRSGAPTWRGFAGDGGKRSMVLLDGLPLSRPDLTIQDWGSLPLQGLESLSVRRGSGVVRYGSGALGGVIEMETRRPDEVFAVEAGSAFGSENTWQSRFSARIPAAPLSFSIEGDWFDSDGYRRNADRRDESLRVAINAGEGEPWTSSLSFSASETDFGNPGGLSYEEYRSNPRASASYVTGFEELYRTAISKKDISHRLEWQAAGSPWRLESRTRYSAEDRTIDQGGFFADNDLQTVAGELVFIREGDWLDLETGLRWKNERLGFDSFVDLGRSNLKQVAGLERTTLAAFAIAEAKLGDNWSLRQGAAVEGYRLDGESRGVGRFGSSAQEFAEKDEAGSWAAETALEFDNDDGSRAWLRYERVYRFPLLDEIAGYQGFLLQVPFNLDLKPEDGHSFELGAEREWSGWTAGAVAYGTWLDGEIAFSNNLNRNLAPTRRVGVDAWMNWEGEWLEAGLRYGWVDAVLREGEFAGNRLPLVPEHTLSGRVAWNPCENFQLSADASYESDSRQGDDFGNRFQRVPSRFLMGLGARWEVDDSLSLQGSVSNIFDETHASYAAAGQFYPGAGRFWSLGAGLKF